VDLVAFSDLDELRRWALADHDRSSLVISVGGDGTQSTAALAAVRRSLPVLPISSGFGNLFARAFGAPQTVDEALTLLGNGRVVRSDVGVRNGELFLCQQTYGLIADVQDAVESGAATPRARWRRWLAYYGAALRHLREAKPRPLRVEVDGRVVTADAALVIVANVKTYGTWLPLLPDASPVDGQFDIFIMRGRTQRQIFVELLRHYFRIPGPEAGTLRCRGQRVLVSGRQAARDELRLLAQRLPIVVSPATAEALARDLPPQRRLGLVEGLVA